MSNTTDIETDVKAHQFTLRIEIKPAESIEALASRLEIVAKHLRAGWRQGSEREEFQFGVSCE